MTRRTRNLLVAALLSASGVALLALLFYGSDRFNSLDHRLTARLLAPSGSFGESLFHGMADLAEPVPLALVLSATALIGIGTGRYRELVGAAIVVFGANLSTQLMKAVLDHPRLQSALGAGHHIEVGYPSGHTTAAVAAGFALWLVAPPRYRPAAILVGATYGILVGTGVVVAGWHYLSDVAGATLVVGCWACLALVAVGSKAASAQ